VGAAPLRGKLFSKSGDIAAVLTAIATYAETDPTCSTRFRDWLLAQRCGNCSSQGKIFSKSGDIAAVLTAIATYAETGPTCSTRSVIGLAGQGGATGIEGEPASASAGA
jgi:hypothetical protein